MASAAASGSPLGSEIFSLVALLVISTVVLLMLRYYLPIRTTPAYILIPIFFALSLPSSIVFLVPIDLASGPSTEDGTVGIWLPNKLLLVAWKITYWLTFALTWFILPLLAEYSDAGYRDTQSRLLYSLRSNAQYQAIVFGSAGLGLVYFFLTSGFNPKALVMALAYCWGLMLAVYLMGHGLVAIPRKLFRNSSISGRLRRLQSAAPKVHEKMDDAIHKLEDLEAQVAELNQRKTGTARDFQDWIEELADLSNLPESRPRTLTRRMSAPIIRVPAVITERYMADLARQLDRARHSRIRWIDEWDRLVRNAVDTQVILDSAGSKRLEIGKASLQASFLERFTFFTPYTRYLYYARIVPCARICFGSILSLASICIVWSEIAKVVNEDLSIIRLTVVHHPDSDRGQIGFAGQVVAACWISYMCAAALTSLTEVKVWRGRALVRRNTAYESAFWYASYPARLTVPLSYNFVTLLSTDVYESTVFFNFLGKLINLNPLPNWFNYLFPMFILIPACATLFNLYGKVKRLIGFGVIDDDDDEENITGYGTGGWREGRDLIERELNGHSSLAHLRGTAGVAPPRPSITQGRASTAARPNPNPQQRTNSVPAAAPEDENFLEAFGHRIRNTLDTANTPTWFKDGFKKPKWMNGSDDTRGGATARSGTSFTRIFGGGNQDGRVRL